MLCSKNQAAATAKIDNYSIFHHLKIFIRVVECGSFSAAAKKLNLTPSSVSRSISGLEESLGVVLLKRTTRSFIMTEAGQHLLNRARRLLGELEESLASVAGFHRHPRGKLRVTCSIAFGVTHLMRIFSGYRRLNPEVTLDLDLNDRSINLNEENVDIALRITAHPPGNFALRKIGKISWIYCASRRYLEQRGIPRHPDELEHHDCLINPNVADSWYSTAPDGRRRALKISGVIEVNSTLGLLHAALHHQGIVRLPTYLLGDWISKGELVPILTEYSSGESNYGLYALYHPGHYRDPKVRSFIDYLLENMANSSSWDCWQKP